MDNYSYVPISRHKFLYGCISVHVQLLDANSFPFNFQNASMSSIEESIDQTNHQLGVAVAATPNGTGTEKGRSTLTVIGCGKS